MCEVCGLYESKQALFPSIHSDGMEGFMVCNLLMT